MNNFICPNCNTKFNSSDKRRKYCSRKCSNITSNTNREVSKETRNRISYSVKKYISLNPLSKTECENRSVLIGMSTKGKYNNPTSILELSKRTVSKILNRLKIGCSQCGWNETICDIHHINGRKIPNADNHNNLTYICPNCHRKAHNNLIPKEKLITLTDFIGDKWKDCYYG